MTRPTADEVWRSLVCMAEAVCTKIEEFNPEVVLVLYKSGSVVWRAVETRWWMTRRTPLPPVVGANIGLSKFYGYDSQDYPWQTLEYGNWDTIGSLIAWTMRHTEWLDMLRRRITDVVGPAAPASMLVVDDVIAEGSTAVITQSLLMELYPRTRTPMVAGMAWHWREVLGEAWLSQLNPATLSPAHRHWLLEVYPCRRPDDKHLLVPWSRLISGFADNDFAPFGWTPLTPPHPLLTALAAWLPIEVWLEFPRWVATTATQRLLRQFESGVNPLDESPYGDGRLFELQWGTVPLHSFLCAMAFQQPWVSVDEAALRFDVSPHLVAQMIADCAEWDYLVPVAMDGVAGFTVGVPTQA
jgi:hypothetical protein